MIEHFFFGESASPIYMFQHALGVVLILIIVCFLIIVILNQLLTSRRKKSNKTAQQKIETKDESIAVSETTQIEKQLSKPSILESESTAEKTAPLIESVTSLSIVQEINNVIPAVETEITVYADSVCRLKEHLFLFTEILLNKKFADQDWDKRMPEFALLDYRNYQRLIFLLINLYSDSEQVTSRFKLVLETTNEIAINHQIYFRHWQMPVEMIAAFKSASISSIPEKEIRKAVQIAEQKNWKLQASASEQGTMINLLMKLQLKTEG